MSFVPPLELHLDEESYVRLLAEARGRKLSIDGLLAELVSEHLAEIDGAEEALKRTDAPQTAISLEEMQRRLAS